MRLLLDTQVALWWLLANPRLPRATRELVATSPCAVSVVSVWEVDLKHRRGKLPVPARRFRDELESAGVVILSLSDVHVLTAVPLPDDHQDPFDRILLAVAEAEHLVLLTADAGLVALARKAPKLPVRGV